MPTTTGQPERSRWTTEDWDNPIKNPFAQEAVAGRGYLAFPGDLDEEPEEELADPAPGDKTSYAPRRALVATRAAVADALGVDEDSEELANLDLEGLHDIISNDLTDPRSALDALDDALAYPQRPVDRPVAPPGQSDGMYVSREGNWRERHGMPRKRKSVPPSRTPEARRLRHLQTLVEAGRFGSIAEAEAKTQRRLSFGWKRAKKP